MLYVKRRVIVISDEVRARILQRFMHELRELNAQKIVLMNEIVLSMHVKSVNISKQS